MPDRIEHIIEDIYILEPALREQDTEVRALVTSLVSVKPAVAVDDAFVQTLRRELLTSVPVPKAIPSPWMMYLAPLGAMAVLVLMLVPGYMTNKTVELPTALPEMMNTEMQMDTEDGVGMKRSADVVPEAASMMMMVPSDDYVMSDMITVFDQTPGRVVQVASVTLTAPGFVVIQADGGGVPGAILGVSPILFAETTDSVEISLGVGMTEGVWYFATVYHDDGDAVFTPETDLAVLDAYTGTPLMFMFGAMTVFPQ